MHKIVAISFKKYDRLLHYVEVTKVSIPIHYSFACPPVSTLHLEKLYKCAAYQSRQQSFDD